MATSHTDYATLRLKKNEERRLKGGHNWVFSNEVDTQISPLTAIEPGQIVLIEDARGHTLGVGYANPHSLICARLVTRNPRLKLGEKLITNRLQQALVLRERLFPGGYYRWIFGDSDGLPGLVVDRYGDVVILQAGTAGMEALTETVVAAIDKLIEPRVIVLRNDAGVRELEQLPKSTVVCKGNASTTLEIVENNTHYRAPFLDGQKTGWFYDHRMNRNTLRRYGRDCRVLDVFSYVGGWGIQAALAGASSVTCIDASTTALEHATDNARLNNVTSAFETLAGDAFDLLKQLREEKKRFDVIVLDPPAFIQRKKDLKNGETAYLRLNQAALQLLDRDGILVSASCSSYLRVDALQNILRQSARHIDRQLQILEEGGQSPDHPIHPAIPETSYLKAFFCRVTPTF